MHPCLVWPVACVILVGQARAGPDRPSTLDSLVRFIAKVEDGQAQLDLLHGMYKALRGRRNLKMPSGWPAVYRKLLQSSNAKVRQQATSVALIFGDPQATALLRRTMVDATIPAGDRKRALQQLVDQKAPGLPLLLHGLVKDEVLRGQAIRGLAAYDDPATPKVLLGHYQAFSGEQKRDAISTLAVRSSYALALLEAVDKGVVARVDISAFTVRQLSRMKDSKVAKRLKQVWGEIRPPSKDKAVLIRKYKSSLRQALRVDPNLRNGRAIFKRTCANCHRMFDDGGGIGPDLTGSQRTNLDYLLENLLDPNAVVARDYQTTLIETKDGRVLNGIVIKDDGKVLTVQTQNDKLVIPKNDIALQQRLNVSIMPEGQLAEMKMEQIRDLVGYLSSSRQVPLPK